VCCLQDTIPDPSKGLPFTRPGLQRGRGALGTTKTGHVDGLGSWVVALGIMCFSVGARIPGPEARRSGLWWPMLGGACLGVLGGPGVLGFLCFGLGLGDWGGKVFPWGGLCFGGLGGPGFLGFGSLSGSGLRGWGLRSGGNGLRQKCPDVGKSAQAGTVSEAK
jgi:hypothetical protein